MMNPMNDPIRLREAAPRDSPAIIRLITAAFLEYPGCVMDVEREEAALLSPARSHTRFWVLEEKGRVVGCTACRVFRGNDGEQALEVKKVYLAASHRGRGLGRRLIEHPESYAAELGIHRLVCWSDSRFEAAHRAYEAVGYVRTGKTRNLHDLSRSVEYGFELRRG
jgi:L-amino acid N-acyltransferase YncA